MPSLFAGTGPPGTAPPRERHYGNPTAAGQTAREDPVPWAGSVGPAGTRVMRGPATEHTDEQPMALTYVIPTLSAEEAQGFHEGELVFRRAGAGTTGGPLAQVHELVGLGELNRYLRSVQGTQEFASDEPLEVMHGFNFLGANLTSPDVSTEVMHGTAKRAIALGKAVLPLYDIWAACGHRTRQGDKLYLLLKRVPVGGTGRMAWQYFPWAHRQDSMPPALDLGESMLFVGTASHLYEHARGTPAFGRVDLLSQHRPYAMRLFSGSWRDDADKAEARRLVPKMQCQLRL